MWIRERGQHGRRAGWIALAVAAVTVLMNLTVVRFASAQLRDNPLPTLRYSQYLQEGAASGLTYGSLPEAVIPSPITRPRASSSRGRVVLGGGLTTGSLQLSLEHSEACSAGRFNQRRPSLYFIGAEASDAMDAEAGGGTGVDGRKGPLLSRWEKPVSGSPSRKGTFYGIASGSGFNLQDRIGIAAPDTNYFFERDGTSNCKVYTTLVQES